MEERREISMIMECTTKDMSPKSAVIVTKGSPYGKHQVQKLYEIQYPEQYKLIELDHELIEFILVRKTELKRSGEEFIIRQIVKHIVPIASEREVLDLDIKTINKILSLNNVIG